MAISRGAMKPTTEPNKLSLLANQSMFADIAVAIADPDAKMAAMVKRILAPIGCRKVFMVSDGQEVLTLMKEEPIDIVITDWAMKTMNGLDLAIHLRQSLESPNRMIPIIMLTGRCDRNDIQAARNAGISEYLVKPFSAKTLMERLYAVVEEPRSFILCKSFVGPDRRRVSSLTLPPDPESGHVYCERKPPIVIPKEQLGQLIIDETPRMIMPDYSLKKKIGIEVPPELLINPLTIAQSEEEIEKAQEDFLTTILQDVESLRQSYQKLVQHPDQAAKLIKAIRDAAESIKSRAGIFGYIRATEVANQLYNFCRRYYDKNNKYHLIILEKHIQTISVIFTGKITGDGGETGSELLRDLGKLIRKYLNHKGEEGSTI